MELIRDIGDWLATGWGERLGFLFPIAVIGLLGLYLSDHSILNGVETELVVLSGIMIQNLPRETGWHLRGTRRIGVSYDDVETIQQCVSAVPNEFIVLTIGISC